VTRQLSAIVRVAAFLIAVSIPGCGGGDFEEGPVFAPAESPHKLAYYRYATPPAGFNAVVGWMQAIDIRGTGAPMRVDVDWMRLHATVNGADTVLLDDSFDTRTAAMDAYGLYSRNPWFAGDRLAPMPSTIELSALVVLPNSSPDRVFHWWNTSRSLIPAGTTRVWFEARIRVVGGAGVQAGIDYWRDLTSPYAGLDVNNTEAGASDWFGNLTADWQTISVGRPGP
jgi:hypothetical protein